MDVEHKIVMTGTLEELEILRRGLQALRAQTELQAAVSGQKLHTEHFDRLDEAIASMNLVEQGMPGLIGLEQQSSAPTG
jgi:malonyl CoA-acyl carrier protein transacylase